MKIKILELLAIVFISTYFEMFQTIFLERN